MRILSASDVELVSATLLPVKLQCLQAQVFHAVTASEEQPLAVQVPHRTSIATEKYDILFMPARLGCRVATDNSLDMAGTSIKIVSVPKQSDTRGLPATTIVMDEVTGAVKAVINARKLTALRNAAGSLLSTSLVAQRIPRHVVAFGAGNQISSHLDLHLRLFSTVERCTIVNRTLNNRVQGLVDRISKSFPHVQLSCFPDPLGASPKDAVASADVIICATSSTVPLFPSHWVKDGTHIVLVGSFTPKMQEIDSDLVGRATSAPLTSNCVASGPFRSFLVDSRKACFKEAGELIHAGATEEDVTEIGEILPVDISGGLDVPALQSLLRAKKDDYSGIPELEKVSFNGPVTIFKSVGIGLQDVAISAAVLHEAEQLNLGQRTDNYDN